MGIKIKGQYIKRSIFWTIMYMNGSIFSKAMYMNRVGFEILARIQFLCTLQVFGVFTVFMLNLNGSR